MHLHRRIDRHIRASGMPPTRFGREVAGDPRLVRDLRNGREVGPDLSSRIVAWLDAHEPVRGAQVRRPRQAVRA